MAKLRHSRRDTKKRQRIANILGWGKASHKKLKIEIKEKQVYRKRAKSPEDMPQPEKKTYKCKINKGDHIFKLLHKKPSLFGKECLTYGCKCGKKDIIIK